MKLRRTGTRNNVLPKNAKRNSDKRNSIAMTTSPARHLKHPATVTKAQGTGGARAAGHREWNQRR